MVENKGKVSAVDWISDRVLHLKINLEKEIELKEGSFIILSYCGVKRPYSVCNFGKTKEIELLIKLKENGKMSEKLKNIRTGDEVSIQGPFLETRFEGDKILLIAGGVGLAAFISFLRKFESGFINKKEVALVYSERYAKDLAFLDELRSMKKTKVVITLTREEKEGFEHGRISREFVEKIFGDLSRFKIYICGSKEFSLAMKEQFGDLNPTVLSW